MLTEDESLAVDNWRFAKRMPSRASAIRELIKRGLTADGFDFADKRTQSKNFGLLEDAPPNRKKPRKKP
jgi:hypothetical protein